MPGRSGIHLSIGCAILVVVTFGMAMLTDHGTQSRLLVMEVSVGLMAALVPDWRYASALGLIGYLLYLGFLVNQYGELGWHGMPSLFEAIIVGLAYSLGRGQRWVRSLRLWGGNHPWRQGRVKNRRCAVGIASRSVSTGLNLGLNRFCLEESVREMTIKEVHGGRLGLRAAHHRALRGAGSNHSGS